MWVIQKYEKTPDNPPPLPRETGGGGGIDGYRDSPEGGGAVKSSHPPRHYYFIDQGVQEDHANHHTNCEERPHQPRHHIIWLSGGGVQ